MDIYEIEIFENGRRFSVVESEHLYLAEKIAEALANIKKLKIVAVVKEEGFNVLGFYDEEMEKEFNSIIYREISKKKEKGIEDIEMIRKMAMAKILSKENIKAVIKVANCMFYAR